ncbi:hypothetical protein PTKIN_Ptkin19aG0133900 [Pterospermum kingtungense]
MGLATMQSREQRVRMKVWKAMNRSGVEAMHREVGMKNHVIRNLPNNAPYYISLELSAQFVSNISNNLKL